MADVQHFPKFSIVSGNVTIVIDLNAYAERFAEAQEWLGWRVLQDCQARMPIRTGSMRQRSHPEDGGRKVVFPGPYARFQYGGKVMVDPVTGSPWARRGAKKVLTDRPLKYADPAATDHWFEEAKAQYGQEWIAELKRMIGGK